jgi:hypothetical protein
MTDDTLPTLGIYKLLSLDGKEVLEGRACILYCSKIVGILLPYPRIAPWDFWSQDCVHPRPSVCVGKDVKQCERSRSTCDIA